MCLVCDQWDNAIVEGILLYLFLSSLLTHALPLILPHEHWAADELVLLVTLLFHVVIVQTLVELWILFFVLSG